jgi:hypothetical protein
MSTTQVFGMTSAKIAIAKQAFVNEHYADDFQMRGYIPHAEGARWEADRLWKLAFDHISQDGAWLDRRLGR